MREQRWIRERADQEGEAGDKREVGRQRVAEKERGICTRPSAVGFIDRPQSDSASFAAVRRILTSEDLVPTSS